MKGTLCFALSFRRLDLASVVLVVSVKSGFFSVMSVVCGLEEKGVTVRVGHFLILRRFEMLLFFLSLKGVADLNCFQLIFSQSGQSDRFRKNTDVSQK